MKILPLASCVTMLLCTQAATAQPPIFHTQTCSVSVDGNRVDTVLTPDGNDQRNTFAYEPLTHLWHFWGFLAPDNNYPSVASSLRAVVHATSSDGVHFTSNGNLSYAFGSASYTSYNSTIDPPLNFFRAVYDTNTGTWKLFNWTDNEGSNVVGQYNYNTSVNDLGTVASTTNVVHQGPLNTPVAGNHVGAFGFVDGELYLRVDNGGLGGVGQFDYTDGAYPWTGANQPSTTAEKNESQLFTGTPYCWALDPNCGTAADPRISSYVHNAGRTLRQSDGTLGTYYTFRGYPNGNRLDQQIWYVESADNGLTWSTPAGVFVNGGDLTIDGAPLDSASGTGLFSDVDLVLDGSRYQLYLSAQDANGNYVMVSAQGRPSDAIFWNGFDACD